MALPYEDFNQMRFIRPVLFQQGDEKTSLLSLIEQFQKQMLKAPPHQRNFIWTKDKIDAWADNLMHGANGEPTAAPIGFMATYQIRDTGEYFLNDGFQRLNATLEFLNTGYKRFKITEEQARLVVQGYKVLVTHRIYDKPTEALYWFQVMQLGTPLTPYDFCKGFLEYLDPTVNWMPTLEDFHIFMENLAKKYAPGQQGFNDFKKSVLRRHNYVLLYNWITRPKSPFSHNSVSPITSRELKLADVTKGKMIEQRLGVELTRLGFVNALNEIKTFQIFLESRGAAIGRISREVSNPHLLRGISPASFRWFLGVATWHRNNNFSNYEILEDFIKLVISNMETSAEVRVVDAAGNAVFKRSLKLQVSELAEIARKLGHPPYANWKANGR
jgi:hypothetical protein